MPACIEEIRGAKAERAFIHKSRQAGGRARGFALLPCLGGAFYSPPPPFSPPEKEKKKKISDLSLSQSGGGNACMFNDLSAGKGGLAGQNGAIYCSEATPGLPPRPPGVFLASRRRLFYGPRAGCVPGTRLALGQDHVPAPNLRIGGGCGSRRWGSPKKNGVRRGGGEVLGRIQHLGVPSSKSSCPGTEVRPPRALGWGLRAPGWVPLVWARCCAWGCSGRC